MLVFWFCLVLFISSLSETQANCQTLCPSSCQCFPQGDGCVVDCSKKGFEEVPISSQLPPNTTILHLNDNEITNISLSSFSSLLHLNALFLQNNSITFIEQGAFSSLSSLEILNLSENHLTTIPDDVFDLSLQSIYLSQNNWLCNCTNARLQNWLRNNPSLINGDVLCDNPYPTVSIQDPVVNLTLCAEARITCNMSENEYILWDFLSNHSTAIESSAACRRTCFAGGYYYSLLENGIACLCAYQQSSSKHLSNGVFHSQSCVSSCSDPAPNFACQREVIAGDPLLSLPQLHFNGIRHYSQIEEVSIQVTDEADVSETYMWNFNDSSIYRLRHDVFITHKYAAAGTYHVTVIATRNKGMFTHSFSLTVEDELEEFDLQCPVHSSDDHVNVTYSLQRGSNPVVSWMIGDEDVASEAINEPHNYVSGSVEFDPNLVQTLYNVNGQTRTASGYSPSQEKNFVMLFPGIWFVDNSSLHSWEVVLPSFTSQTTIRLQIYRPTCSSSHQLLKPGCQVNNTPSPFSTCSSITCSSQTEDCSPGMQYCYFNNTDKHCRSLLTPCSLYYDNSATNQPDYADQQPSYDVMHEFYLTVDQNKRGLYQVFVDDDISVEVDDVIAVEFEAESSSSSFPSLSQLPISCSYSNNSRWRQSALLFALNTSDPINLVSGVNDQSWLHAIWCDIRVHYSKASSGVITLSTESNTADQTYEVTVFNQVSNQTRECLVQHGEGELQLSIVSPPTEIIDGVTVVYVEKNKATNLSILVNNTSGQNKIVVALSGLGRSDSSQDKEYETECDENTSDLCSKVVNASLTTEETGSSTYIIEAESGTLSATARVDVVIQELITGVTILPQNLTRVLAGTYQEFSYTTTTGSDITSRWIIDDLTQFSYSRSNLEIIFRTPATYTITSQLSNNVGSENVSHSFEVSDMNRLSIQNIDGDTNVESNVNTTFTAQVQVDVNINVTITWFVDDVEQTSQFYAQPQTGSLGATSKQVIVSNNFSHQFNTLGDKKLKVTALNDYDETSFERDISVRPRITDLDIAPATVPISNEQAQFQITVQPSSVGSTFTIDWGDNSSPTETTNTTVPYTYSSSGDYTIEVVADNDINNLTITTALIVYDRVSGLTITSNSPTELGYNTSITASLASGNDSFTIYDFECSNSFMIVNTSFSSAHCIYPSAGYYNVTVRATNPASMEEQYIEVQVFDVEVVRVETDTCYSVNIPASLQAVMPVEDAQLFTYSWNFGDLSSLMSGVGLDNINHTYSNPDSYAANVTVTSILSGKSDTENFNVCVQSPIDSLSFSSTQQAVKTLANLTFNYQVTGGTQVSLLIDFGDGQVDPLTATRGSVDHAYAQAGNYTILLSASNLVSVQNQSVEVIVQDPISILNVTTSSEYGYNVLVNEEVQYTVSYSGSNATSITWSFDSTSSNYNGESGVTVPFTYSSVQETSLDVQVSNLVSNDTQTFNIRVFDPVGNVTIATLPDIVLIGSSVWINVTAPGSTRLFWLVSLNSSSDNVWDFESSLENSYLHIFTESGLYNITVKSQNEASAQYVSDEILVAEPLGDALLVEGFNLSSGYSAISENSSFAAKLLNGSELSLTTYGDENFFEFEWSFIKDGIVKHTSTSAIGTYHFPDLGIYEVRVNASNMVSSSTGNITVEIIERITNITVNKLDLPPQAVAVNGTVQLQANISSGSLVSYEWIPASSYSGSDPSIFETSYSTVGYNTVTVNVSNPLEAFLVNYTVQVLEPVEDLTIEHVNPNVPFYVPHNEYSRFRADLTSGTDVTFTWQFINQINPSNYKNESTMLYTYDWNFTEIATYTMTVTASNLVSTTSSNTTVTVLDPVKNPQISVSRQVLQTNQELELNVTAETSSGAWFSLDFSDGSAIENSSVLATSFSTRHTYTDDGIYDIVATVYNNVSRVNTSRMVIVREVIDGLDITGCNPDDFVRSDWIYNLTANTTSGTNIQYNWSIVYSDGTTELANGSLWSLQMYIVGTAQITLFAENELHTRNKTITIFIQDPPSFSARLVNRGTIYENDTVDIEIYNAQGTDVLYNVDFGDGNTIVNTSLTSFENHYIDHGVYEVNITAHNEVAQYSTTLIVTIDQLSCVAPQLSFVVGETQMTVGIKFFRSRQIYLETNINTFDCTAYALNYRWQIYRQDDCNNLNDTNKVLLKFSISTSPLLSLPPLTLDVGKYCFTNVASYLTTPLSSTISMVVEVLSTPLAVLIKGGTERFISSSSTVVLDATSSFDPDLESDDQTALTYLWSCSSRPRNSTVFTSGAGNCFVSKTVGLVLLRAGDLLSNYEYNFTVTVSKTGKEDMSAWQILIIVPENIPTVTITCVSCQQLSSLSISSGHHLTLQASCDDNCKVTDTQYFWEASRRNSSSDQVGSVFPLNAETTTTGNTKRYLVVEVSPLLFSYYEYEFSLTIQSQGVSGTSKLVLPANKPPANGRCSLSYDGTQVYVLETLVRFSCEDWVDEDLSPLIYTILATRNKENEQVDEFFIYRGTSSSFEGYVPVGFKENNYNIRIQILVEDQLGTFAVGYNETLNVRLNNNVETIKWLRNNTFNQLANLVKSSNPQVVADYAAGLITVLNQESEIQGHSTSDPEFEIRKEIRRNITFTVTSLASNTFAKIQQVAAVFKECMRVPAELQNANLFNISLLKLQELTALMPDYVSVATQTSFVAVTTDLIGVISYLLESINYDVYNGGDSLALSEAYRRQHIESLISYAEQLTEYVLDGMVEGEEAIFLNASGFSSIGALTTPATLNRSILNDGCYMQLPDNIFSHLSDSEQIFFIFLVSQQNPYTFGYISSLLTTDGAASITSRVPSLQFKFLNKTLLPVTNLQSTSNDQIKMIMAPSERMFIGDEATDQLAELSQSSSYNPRNSINFDLNVIKPRYSVGMQVTNNNTNPDTALYIMIVFDKILVNERVETNPYIDVYFDDQPLPNDSRFTTHLRLTEALVSLQADHRGYTIYIDPKNASTVLPYYYLNISSSFEYYEVQVGVGVYYSSCQFFNVETKSWSTSGLTTSAETLPSAAVCYSDHLTSFGSFVINPPNTIVITDIVNIDFAQNPVALILVSVIFAIYLIAVIRSRQLDQRDIKNVSIVPLCGPNLSHKYEITVKTSPGIGSGTTANVGICVYGYEGRTGARHLFKEDAFQRGAVDVFHVASDVSLGTIYKLKIWHDNTGLDPGWNVSRIMVKDLQSDIKYYFLIDAWLQVYPDDVNETCLQKTVRAASDEEMSDFSTRFGTQLSYGWEDAHLWLSLIERPPRSSFTRVQRATCCVTLLYMFVLFSAVWYQGTNDTGEFGVNLAQDIAVGAIVSVLVFPINLLIVFLFKSAKCKVSPMMSWIHDRAQTAQTVEILDEVLDGRSRKSTLSRMFPFSRFSIGDATSAVQQFTKNDNNEYESRSSQISSHFASEDTGISTGTSPSNDSNGLRLRRRNTSYPSHFDDEFDDDYNDFFGPYVSEESLRDVDLGNPRPTNLKRTQKGKFQDKLLTTTEEEEIPDAQENPEYHDDAHDYHDDETSMKSYDRDIPSPDSSFGEPEVRTFSLRSLTLPPSFPMYVAYFLCICACGLSIFFIIFYGHSFGVDIAKKWVVSMVIALLESIFIIEPIKVLFLAIYLSMFTEETTPEQKDQIVSEPLLQAADHCCRDSDTLQKLNKIRPPRGFALEQCKEQAKKSVRARKYIIHFIVYTMLLWSVVAFCMWDRSFLSYRVSNPLHRELEESPIIRNGTSNITFEGIKTDADMWAWLNQVFDPTVMNKNETFFDNGNNFNNLLGQVRLRQQRQLPSDRCPASSSSVWSSLAPDFRCISPTHFSPDIASYFPGWSSTFTGSSATWINSPASLTGYGYWGSHRVYDDSGYIVYLDPSTASEQISLLQEQGWTDRLTRVCFVEFTQYNPATYWFIVSVYMFEFDSTGVIHPSHITQTVRLFSPSSGFYLDQIFIIPIALLSVFLWAHEIIKLWRAREKWSGLWKACNLYNITINLLLTTIFILFIYKEVYLEEVMRNYKNNRTVFHNFYGAAFITNIVLYMAGILLMLLIIKSVKFFRFFRSTSVFEETLSRGFKHIAATTLMLLLIILAYSLVGYLIFGLNSVRVIRDFQDFQNSFYSMFRVLGRNLDPRPCYEVMPVFTIFFFLSFYFGIFFIFAKLFAAILIKEYKHVCITLKYPKPYVPEYVIMEYMIDRVKMRLGLAKPKQFRPTVHFEGMSNHSSESSFISLDSLGSCFTPERISQCSDASGISTSDSGLGTPSDHSISLFDYLTLEHPPFEKPMDDLHLDYLYDRLSTYSVDMMLHKVDRVNKLGDDVLSITSKLIEVTQNQEQKIILEKESSDIAKAVSTNPVLTKQDSSDKIRFNSSMNASTSGVHIPVSVGGNISSLLEESQRRNSHPRPPVRSSSYVDSSTSRTRTAFSGSLANASNQKRPRSYEGVRSFDLKNRSKNESRIKMKKAW